MSFKSPELESRKLCPFVANQPTKVLEMGLNQIRRSEHPQIQTLEQTPGSLVDRTKTLDLKFGGSLDLDSKGAS